MLRAGLQELPFLAFVLVAGGLGERLGYNVSRARLGSVNTRPERLVQGIKIELPSEVSTGRCFLDLYCQTILEFQRRARAMTGRADIVLPLFIMTSGDTHDATMELLRANKNFGTAEGQIIVRKQELVGPCAAPRRAHRCSLR
jgi:UDP-sugar pyrophosphorylase